MRREWIEILLPALENAKQEMSPSMRREWIEISNSMSHFSNISVSLHAEGVD